jgi:hypothetical protein
MGLIGRLNIESLHNLNDILKKGSIGDSENFNFLDNVVEAMNNLEPKKKYQQSQERMSKSNSQVLFGFEPKNTVRIIQPQNSSINLLEKPTSDSKNKNDSNSKASDNSGIRLF